jgi:hypothetical protein
MIMLREKHKKEKKNVQAVDMLPIKKKNNKKKLKKKRRIGKRNVKSL